MIILDHMACIYTMAIKMLSVHVYTSGNLWYIVPWCLQPQDGATALIIAAQNGHLQVIEKLKNAGAQLDFQANVSLCWILCST